MRLYWTTTTELTKLQPKVFTFDLKKEGMFIGVPGTLIFRTRGEAQQAIENAKKLLQESEVM